MADPISNTQSTPPTPAKSPQTPLGFLEALSGQGDFAKLMQQMQGSEHPVEQISNDPHEASTDNPAIDFSAALVPVVLDASPRELLDRGLEQQRQADPDTQRLAWRATPGQHMTLLNDPNTERPMTGAEVKVSAAAAAQLSTARLSSADVQPFNAALTEKTSGQAGEIQRTLAKSPAIDDSFFSGSEAESQKSAADRLSLRNFTDGAGAPRTVENPIYQDSSSLNATWEHLSMRDNGEAAIRESIAAGNDASPGPALGSLPGAAASSQDISTAGAKQPLQSQIQSAFGSEQWAEDLQKQLVGIAVRGENQVALHLNPRHLGPLVVELKMVDNQAQLQFLSNQPSVRNAVEQAIPALRDMLGEQGIALGDTSFSQQGNSQNSAHGGSAHQQAASAPITVNTAGETPGQPGAAEPLMSKGDNGEINVYI